jgi:hypothetical protein
MESNGKLKIRTYTVTLKDGSTREVQGTRLEETDTGILIWNGRKAVISFQWSELERIV